MKKLRILYFSYVPDIKGTGIGPVKKITKLAEGLNKENICFKIIFRTTQNKYKARVKEYRRGLLKKYFNEPYHLVMNLKNIFEEFFLIKKFQPDILIIRLEVYNFSGLFLAKLLKIPFIIEADSPVVYEYDRIWGKGCIRSFIPESIEFFNLSYAKAIIVISNQLKDYYTSKGIEGTKIIVIPNGADPHELYPVTKNNELRKALSLPSEVIIGWMGSGWSGTKDLLRLIQRTLKMENNICFLIIGKIVEQLKGGAGILLTGIVEREHILDYISLMDIALAPYPQETFYASPIKVYEYMAVGKVVIASPVPQVLEIIDHDINGIIADFRDSNAVAREIIKLLHDPERRKKLGQNARNSILEKHTWQKRSKVLAQLLIKI